jgi:hypothetical protein
MMGWRVEHEVGEVLICVTGEDSNRINVLFVEKCNILT